MNAAHEARIAELLRAAHSLIAKLQGESDACPICGGLAECSPTCQLANLCIAVREAEKVRLR